MPLHQRGLAAKLAYYVPATVRAAVSTATVAVSTATFAFSAATLSLAAAASEASTRLRFGMECRSDDVLSDVESERCSALLWRWRRVCVSANGQQGRSTVPQTCRGLLPRL